jgi:hypothetical protein
MTAAEAWDAPGPLFVQALVMAEVLPVDGGT